MEKLEKTQWHPPFCAAVKLELRDNKKDLHFESEHLLNSKPIQIDLLVIKKLSNIAIKNEIGRLFREHNLFEYKSPKDSLGVDEYFKTLAYACLYKANCPKADSIKTEELTISLVREGKPRELIKWFLTHDCTITEAYPGIYHINGESILFKTQLIISSKLNPLEHQWLRSLTSKMDMETGKRLVLSANDLSEKDDKEYADSILQLALSENKSIFNRIREVPKMCEALKTLMKPELDEAENIGRKQGHEQGLAQGMTEGEAKLARLINALIESGRNDDISKVSTDKEYRARLYNEFNIT